MEGVCPGDDWEHWGEHCFLFVVEELSWEEAGEACRSKGAGYNGELASIHNRVTNEWINSRLTAEDIDVRDGTWIGLKRHDLGEQRLDRDSES